MAVVKPMRASRLERFDQLRYPVLGSPKIDAVRGLVVDGVLMSKNMKPIRNRHLQRVYGLRALNGLDGELALGEPNVPELPDGTTLLGRSMSAVMSYGGEPEVVFHLFDRWDKPARPFGYRIGLVEDLVDDHPRKPLALVRHELLADEAAAAEFERRCLAQGYEGVCFRDPDGPYKPGKSTPREGWFWKLKRFEDGEATVLKVIEGYANDNEAFTDELGRKKRSTAAAGRRPSGLMGSMLVRRRDGHEFVVAAGKATAEQRAAWLRTPSLIVGRTVTWRAFTYGTKDADRFPLFYAVRHRDDISED